MSLFDRLEWFRRTLQFCAPPGEPLIVRARTEGFGCWLFLIAQRGHAVALGSWYSLSFRPIFTGDPDERTRHAMLVAIGRRLRKHAATITLSPMPEGDAARLTRAFDRAGWLTAKRPTTVSWTISTDGMTFAEYWAQRPGELRSTVKRKAAKFNVETSVFTDFDGVAWSNYEDVYAASWKPDEGSNEFLRHMALAEGKAGALRLGLATIDGQFVAAQLWTVENGHAVIHKLAHLESAAEASPGSILTATMFEHVIDRDHVKLVDFGTGDDRYKADWMDMRTPLMTVRFFNPRKVAGLSALVREGARMLVGRPPSG
ncbi:MAG: GNAT family N-acetyltransferase [Sphingomonadaceae bacterium]